MSAATIADCSDAHIPAQGRQKLRCQQLVQTVDHTENDESFKNEDDMELIHVEEGNQNDHSPWKSTMTTNRTPRRIEMIVVETLLVFLGLLAELL